MAEISWIKLATNLPDNKKIKRIRKLPDGDKVILFWVFLLARAGESNKSGGLFMTDTLPYEVEDLAADFDFTVEFVKFAIITLEKYSMIKTYDDIIFVKNWEKYQAVEGMDKVREQNRIRQAKFKERQKQLTLGNVTSNVTGNGEVTQGNATDIDIDIDKEIDKEIDKDIEIELEEEKENPDNFQKLIQFYTQNFGNIQPVVMETLRFDFTDYGHELIIEAMTRAVLKGARYSYAQAILKSWANSNITTLDQVRIQDEEFQRRMSPKTQDNTKSSAKVPDWHNDKPKEEREPTEEEMAELAKMQRYQQLSVKMKNEGLTSEEQLEYESISF
ncbi:phage replisome organizer N-terminal domain-containing protein [Floricoccus tropicus]|uniref:phage replisome organizer N-terminal domain-containing protein n=1 Tax=Floricoccus tropicus TaxID=1859473 RepID=UPI0009499540|nr:phage replisome organizer N-terminal domain-containing protein [Floricoccus tropicus]